MFEKIKKYLLKKYEISIWQLVLGICVIFAATGILETVSLAVIVIAIGCFYIIVNNPKNNPINNQNNVGYMPSVIDEKDFRDACIGYGYGNIVRKNSEGRIQFFRDVIEDHEAFYGKCERLKRKLTHLKAKEMNTTTDAVQPVVYTIYAEGAVFQL